MTSETGGNTPIQIRAIAQFNKSIPVRLRSMAAQRGRQLLVDASYRPIAQPLVGMAVTGYMRIKKREHVRCQVQNGQWIHWYDNGVVVDRKPTLLTPTERAAMARDIYLHCYDPSPGDVILDVGAGVGAESLEFSRLVGRDGRIVACEANPDTARCAETLFRLTATDNVTLLIAAASDASGVARIQAGKRHLENRIVASNVGDASYAVPAISLDDAMSENVGRVDFIKMNIEGAELRALRGMPNLLSSANAVAIFCHDFVARYRPNPPPPTRAGVEILLREAGYDCYRRLDDPRPGVQDCVYGVRR